MAQKSNHNIYNQSMLISGILTRIEDRYDPENDIIPGAPNVTWAERELADAISHLLTIVYELQKEIEIARDTKAEGADNADQ